MSGRSYTATIAALFLALAPALAVSGDAITLKEIMQGLRTDLVKITDGLLVGDFDLIASGARGIAEHPKIPAEQVGLVAAELGPQMPAFKEMDARVHDLSLELQSAARTADANAAYRSYVAITEGCIACHASFRERVAGVLTAADSP